MIFCEKKIWGDIFDFFPKAGTFEAKIVKNIFFNFQKFLKQIPKKTFIGLLEPK